MNTFINKIKVIIKPTKRKNNFAKAKKIHYSNFAARSFYWFKNLSFLKHILLFYLFITIIGSLMLYSSAAQTGYVQMEYVDCLFTSASAFSDTGLVTHPTVATWTYFGQAIIAILILSGGIGVFALKVFFINILFNRPMSLTIRAALSSERGSTKHGDTRNLVKVSVITMFIIIIISSIVLSFYFYYIPGNFHSNLGWTHFTANNKAFDPQGNLGTSVRYGIFHSISAINNAGFDIMSKNSLGPYYQNYFIQIWFVILFVTGGIGYPVIFDIWSWMKAKKNKKLFRFSLFTKITTSTYLLIVIIGLGLTFSVEMTTKSPNAFWNLHKSQAGTVSNKIMALFFNTLSTRNAGFATIDVYQYTSSTKIIHSVLMFVGSSPSSTAGGIRTTTAAIIVMGIWSRLRGKTTISLFKRRIPSETIRRSYIVLSLSLILVIVITVIATSSYDVHGGKIPALSDGISSKNQKFGFEDLFFEVSSAFGTTGLSTGITGRLNTTTKIIMVLLMFIGQLGVSSTILVWGNKKQRSKHYYYLKENVTIG